MQNNINSSNPTSPKRESADSLSREVGQKHCSKRFWLGIGVGVAMLGILIVLYFVNPENCAYMPKCIIKLITGLDCPSCGAQRAIHAMLHGHPLQAINYNLFLIYAIPYLLLIIVFGQLARRNIGIRFHKFLNSRPMLLGFVAIYIAWFIVRNILGI